jgi:peptide deformylase
MGHSFHAAQVRYRLARHCGRYNTEIRRLTHRVKEQGHTTATIGALAQSMIDFSRRDDGVGIGCAHPIDRSTDVMIRNGLAVADDH